MYFKQVKLENFRNYKEQTVEFNKKLNLLLRVWKLVVTMPVWGF